MNDDDITRLLRSADTAPSDVPVDPVVLARVEQRVRKETTMSKREQGGRTPIVRLAVASALVVLAVALGLTRLSGESNETSGGGVALGGGGAITSCIAFSVEQLGQAPIAFDGTVTRIDGGTIELRVEKWYRGGDSEEIRVFAPDLANAEALVGAVGFEVGKRYLVSATEFEGKIVPSVCGFTVTYDEAMADTFAQAFA